MVLSDAETFAKGKVKVAVFSDSITCKRVSKVPKSLQALKGKLDELLVFEVSASDAFTGIKRKRKLVIMVQSDVEGKFDIGFGTTCTHLTVSPYRTHTTPYPPTPRTLCVILCLVHVLIGC